MDAAEVLKEAAAMPLVNHRLNQRILALSNSGAWKTGMLRALQQFSVVRMSDLTHLAMVVWMSLEKEDDIIEAINGHNELHFERKTEEPVGGGGHGHVEREGHARREHEASDNASSEQKRAMRAANKAYLAKFVRRTVPPTFSTRGGTVVPCPPPATGVQGTTVTPSVTPPLGVVSILATSALNLC